MAPEIVVDEEVYEHLKEQAEPFVDTPSTVLRRLLGIVPPGATESESAIAAGADHGQDAMQGRQIPPRQTGSEPRLPAAGVRAPKGTLLPQTEYWIPILEALADAGGSAVAVEVIATVGERLCDRLTPLDYQPLRSGGIRWRNRAQFARLRMVERGLMEKGSPPGIWKITEAGRQFLDETNGNMRT